MTEQIGQLDRERRCISMKISSAKTNSTETILSVSPISEDHESLHNIFRQHSSASKRIWKLLTSSSVESALNLLRQTQIPIAICERDLRPGTWRNLLEPTLL